MQFSDHSVSEAESILGEKAATLSPGRLCLVAEDCMFLCGLREAIFSWLLTFCEGRSSECHYSGGEKFSFY